MRNWAIPSRRRSKLGFVRFRPVLMTALAMINRHGSDGAWPWRGRRAERPTGTRGDRRADLRDGCNADVCTSGIQHSPQEAACKNCGCNVTCPLITDHRSFRQKSGIFAVVAGIAAVLVVATGIRAREDSSAKLREWTDPQTIPTVAVVLARRQGSQRDDRSAGQI